MHLLHQTFQRPRRNFGGLNGRCVSVALDGHDVTFGCVQKVTDAFAEMMEEHHPRAVFLVTTCVVEIIGDDIDALAGSLPSTMACR